MLMHFTISEECSLMEENDPLPEIPDSNSVAKSTYSLHKIKVHQPVDLYNDNTNFCSKVSS